MNAQNDKQKGDAFEVPPLPMELQTQVDELMTRRFALLDCGEHESDEVADLILKAEKIGRDWRELCESRWRAERKAASTASSLGAPAPAAENRNAAAPAQNPATFLSSAEPISEGAGYLAEFLALKAREGKGEIPAGSSFKFFRENKTAIQTENIIETNPNAHIAGRNLVTNKS
jgi:hypothetical protein